MCAGLYIGLTNQEKKVFFLASYLILSVDMQCIPSLAIQENFSQHKRMFSVYHDQLLSLTFSDAKDHILLSLHLFSVLPQSGTNITKCRWHVWETRDEPEEHCFLILVSSWWCQEGIIIRKPVMSVGKAWLHTDFTF